MLRRLFYHISPSDGGSGSSIVSVVDDAFWIVVDEKTLGMIE